MYSDKGQPVRWYIVFSQSKYDHWILRMMDRDMAHVYAIKDLNDYQWLMVQPRVNIIETRILLKSQYPHINLLVDPSSKVLHVTANPGIKPIFALNISSCVELIKGLLGIKSFWTITPKQLYNGLITGRYKNADC